MHTSAINVNKSLQSFHGNGKEQIHVEITTDYREFSRWLCEGDSVRREFPHGAFTKLSVNRKELTHTRKIKTTIIGKKYLTFLYFQNQLK